MKCRLLILISILVLVNCSTQRKSSNIDYSQDTTYYFPQIGKTTLSYALNKKQQVILIAYDDKDNVLDTLVNEIQNAGIYSINDHELKKFSGIVKFKLETEDSVVTKKMILSK